MLPDLQNGGLEINLTCPGRVDLHQGYFYRAEWAAHLITHIEQQPLLCKNDGWHALKAFCQCWLDENLHLASMITKLSLEFDNHSNDEYIPVPSVFLGFADLKEQDRPSRDILPALEQLLAITVAEKDSVFQIALIRQIVNALPKNAEIGHVGIMLSRTDAPIRVNVHGLEYEQYHDFLCSIGWPGSVRYISQLGKSLAWNTKDITICLDVGETVRPRLGFECFLPIHATKEQWRPFIDQLMEDGLCGAKSKQLLLDWPGYSSLSSNPAPPSSRYIDLLERKISHIKIDYLPESKLVAKGYLAFQKTTLDLDKRGIPHKEKTL